MRVEATSASYLYTASLRATERVQKITANAAQADSAPQAVEDAPRAETAKPVDFSRMTRCELFNWTNEQVRNGNMTLEESFPFVLLSSDGLSPDAIGLEGLSADQTCYNYVQIAQDGLAQAQTREDGAKMVKRWESVLSVMQRFQGQSMSVDVFA